jgi:glycosyltransferase involved in cell wall biosynthesis
MRKKILLKGPLLTRSGYGEQSRFALRSLRSREDLFDIFIQPLQWGQTSWLNIDSEERRWIDQTIEKTIGYIQQNGQFDIALQITIPNEWEQLAPINVGYTAGIETTKVAPEWIMKGNQVDKIIVVSTHSKGVYENTVYEGTNEQTGQQLEVSLNKTIDVVNYPVKLFDSLPDVNLNLEYDFNFLVVAQFGPRKNIPNTVKWFVEEFKDEEVGLVVKTNIAKNCLMDREHLFGDMKNFMTQLGEHKCKVYLLHGDMTDAEMHSLYRHSKIDALVALPHGEGFGLPIFEAAYSGLPVVATGWSGQMDFLVDEGGREHFYNVSFDIQPVQENVVWDGVIIKDSMWAYAREQSAKEKMRECYNDRKKAINSAEYADNLHERFSAEKMYAKFVHSVYGEPEEVPDVDVQDLPKVSIITSVYDGDDFIRPFLEDMTRQTIFEEKCELILINANSPGNEEEIIKEYVEKYPNNIVYKKLEEDPGIYGVWNIGVEMSTGEFLTNANLDDRKAPNSLERHAQELYLDSEVQLVYADMLITDTPNETFENNNSNGRQYSFPQFSLDNLKMVNMPHASPMWRKSLHDAHGLFEDKYRSAGDWEMWLRAASQGSKFKKINTILGLYFFNPKGISTNPDNLDWKSKEEKEVYEKYK